jgi:hypothetical protein
VKVLNLLELGISVSCHTTASKGAVSPSFVCRFGVCLLVYPLPFVCAMAWLCVVYLSVLILNSTSISRTKISSDVTQLDNAIRLIWPCHGVCCWPVRVRALTSHLSTTCLECLWSACPLTSLLCRTFLRTRLQQ